MSFETTKGKISAQAQEIPFDIQPSTLTRAGAVSLLMITGGIEKKRRKIAHSGTRENYIPTSLLDVSTTFYTNIPGGYRHYSGNQIVSYNHILFDKEGPKDVG